MLYSSSRLGSLLPDLTPVSFRNTAFALTTAATLFAGTAAFAQDKAADACKALGPTNAGVKCAIKYMDNQIAESKRQGAAADARAAAEDILHECLLALKSFKEKSPEQFSQFGPINRDNACTIAAKVRKLSGDPKPSG